jgi:hypothetical protein
MLKKFWLGETPMWFNFWILGVLFFRVLFIGLVLGLDALNFNPKFLMNTISFITIPLTLFWAVGTWRSAMNYKGKSVWSILTELYIIITIAALILPYAY